MSKQSSIENYTCYESDSASIDNCFNGPNGSSGVYIPAVSHNGTSCAWLDNDGADYGYFSKMGKYQQTSNPKKIFAMLNADGSASASPPFESFDPFVDCMRRASTTQDKNYPFTPVSWDGVFVDYEHDGGKCPDIKTVRDFIGNEKPIYVVQSGTNNTTCINDWKTTDPSIIPVKLCYDGLDCQEHTNDSNDATNAWHYMYSSSSTNIPTTGKYDWYYKKSP